MHVTDRRSWPSKKIYICPLLEHQSEDHVNEGKYGPTQEEPQVSTNLSDEARVVAHDILPLVGEEEVLEPELDDPVGVLVQAAQPVGRLGVGEAWARGVVKIYKVLIIKFLILD